MSNAQVIYNFLVGKGLSQPVVAGILGNLQQESGFRTNALNSREGAIGIAQWEGGRRTSLQRFAASRGTSETDLQTQLDFLWHELTTSKRYVLDTLKYLPDAASAAAEWDSQFEVSSGSTRQARINNANHIYGLIQQGGSGLASLGPSGSGVSPSSGGETLLGGGDGGSPKMTAADYSSIDGLGQLLKTVPELKSLLDRAVKTGMPVADFQDAVENTKWWKQHSATARSVITQQVNDPATYQANLNAATQTITRLAHQMGVQVAAGSIPDIAKQALLTGNDQNEAWLRMHIGQQVKQVSPEDFTGQMAQNAQQLQQLAAQYGHTFSDATLRGAALHLTDGFTTIDTYRQYLINTAISRFPGLADQLKSGLTLADIASPYQQAMANTLELNPASVKITDPLITKALQGIPGTGKSTVPQAQPLWQFEQTLRADPRWGQTQNAKDTVSSALMKIGTDWGFLG